MQWFITIISGAIILLGLYLIATSQWMQLSDARAQAYQTGKPVHARLRDGRAFVVSPDGRAVIVSPDGRVTHDTLSPDSLTHVSQPDTSAWVNEPDTLTHSVSLTHSPVSQASQPDTPASKPANYYDTLLRHLDTPVSHHDSPVNQAVPYDTPARPAMKPVHDVLTHRDSGGRFNMSQVLPTPVPASLYTDSVTHPDTPARPEGTKRERAVSLLARGMTQAEVADTLGISQQMVSKYKRASERNRMKWA